ncbi:MAG TPA: hypothetical protein VNG90_01380 [Candidatus Acidoferrum sp.]|nr:hypothetical protein [Candidatus Acidoferrum sp.]
MKKDTQTGFGLVEIILGIVVLGMAGLVAWQLLSANHMFGLGSTPVNQAVTNSTGSVSAQPLSGGSSNQDLQNDLTNVNANLTQDSQNMDAASSSVNDQQNQISVPTN